MFFQLFRSFCLLEFQMSQKSREHFPDSPTNPDDDDKRSPCFFDRMRIFWILLLLLVTAASSFPLFSFSLSEATTEMPLPIHHRHKHHHHKHRRRSLSSKEDAKTRGRNKQVMLTKPYWPWP